MIGHRWPDNRVSSLAPSLVRLKVPDCISAHDGRAWWIDCVRLLFYYLCFTLQTQNTLFLLSAKGLGDAASLSLASRCSWNFIKTTYNWCLLLRMRRRRRKWTPWWPNRLPLCFLFGRGGGHRRLFIQLCSHHLSSTGICSVPGCLAGIYHHHQNG